MSTDRQNDALTGDETTDDCSSQLFTVRIWPERVEQEAVTWRGKVQHIPTGAWRYVRDWEGLVAFFETQLVDDRQPGK